ncbi:FUSC family protein [Streptomyces sp. NBC_01264]|uniref:FUSC family protein n=1 Tax=Streptomyces sp. NBC_01264 TaxID=2903804 RepID=UPI002256838D|nr:FUSC family protein [Streptomyces sp. NBC_01264]MCX4784351.1 FUSC family protein [Streptomyces sp. NBC_01264]
MGTTRAARPGRVREIAATDGPTAARILVTGVVGWQAALWLGADSPPVYAAIVPLVALRGDPMSALTVSFQRVLGVVAGVLLGITVLNLMRPSTAALALVLAVGLTLGMILRAGGLNLQVAVSSLLVFANPSPDAYAFHRLWETATGAVVTILLAPLLWPPDPRRFLPVLVEDCRTRLIQGIDGSVAAVGAGLVLARENLAAATEHCAAVRGHAARAQEAARLMRFNPLHRRHRGEVQRLVLAVETADRLAVHVSVLAQDVAAFADRLDLASVLADARPRLAEIAAPTTQAIVHALSGADPQSAVATARGLLTAYVHSDSRPAVVTLRRPFLRILDDLGA